MYNSSKKITICIKATQEKIVFVLPCEYARKLEKSTRLLINMLRAEIPYIQDNAIKGATSIAQGWAPAKESNFRYDIITKNDLIAFVDFVCFDNVEKAENN